MEIKNVNKFDTNKEYIDFCFGMSQILKELKLDYKLVGNSMIAYPDDYCNDKETSRYITLYDLDDEHKILRFNSKLNIQDLETLKSVVNTIKDNTLESSDWDICRNVQYYYNYDPDFDRN